MCLRTANIDYNAALHGQRRAVTRTFGIDRAANPDDILGADVILVSGANIAECAPIPQLCLAGREQGAKVIVVDPRITPIARTCDLFLPVKPDATALFKRHPAPMIGTTGSIIRLSRTTPRVRCRAAQVHEWTPSERRSHRHRGETIQQAAEWLARRRRAFSAMRGGSSPQQRRQERDERLKSCWPPAASGARTAATRRSRTGNGQGGASTDKMRSTPRGRDLAKP